MEERRYSSWMLERIAIGDTVRLRLGTSTMGRHSSSDIRILDATFVSRHHAVIEVPANDENLTLTDVSSNGIYVNNQKYEKTTVKLKVDDLIGIGISPIDNEDDVDFLKLPIYQLRYSPIRPLRLTSANKSTPKPALNPVIEINNSTTTEINNKKVADNNTDQKEETPCCSKTVKVEKSNNNNEIFEISDDDDDIERDVVERPKISNPEIKNNQEPQHKIITNLTKQIDTVPKEEPIDDKYYINPSQKSQEKKSDEINLNQNNDKNSEFPINPPQKSLNENTVEQALNKEGDQLKTLEQQPSSTTLIKHHEEKEPLLHVPILSNIKKEHIRSVSADIQNIFGDIKDHHEIQKTIKEINPLVYNELHVANNLKPLDEDDKMLINGDLIVLTDDEDLEEVEIEELGTIIPQNTDQNTKKKEEKSINVMVGSKSPNIFDSSLDNSKEDVNLEEIKQNKEELKTSDEVKLADNIELDDYTNYAPQSDDEDIEDLMFSQVIFNDMKAELQDDLNVLENIPLPQNQDSPLDANIGDSVVIKQEPGLEVFSSIPKEVQNSCWIISDDDDYDEELETKVNDWSNRIFSQSFNLLSQNMSQVYELEEPDNDDDIDQDDLNDEDNLNLLEDDIEAIADIYNNNEAPDVNKKIKTLNEEIQKSEEEMFKDVKEQEGEQQETVKNVEFETNEKNVCPIKEQFPDKHISDRNNLAKSLLIRLRRLSTSKSVIATPSSSEDESELEKQSNSLNIPEPDKPITRLLPPVVDNLNLLDDDIEAMSDIYNKNEDPDVNKNIKIFNEETPKSKEEMLKDSNEKSLKQNNMKKQENEEQENVKKIEIEISDKNDFPIKEIKEKSTDKHKSDSNNLAESPLIRIRRLSKTKSVIASSSSSEDEFELEKQSNSLKVPEPDKPITRLPPPVIEAPSLPKHKGKLRGVSAEIPTKITTNGYTANKKIKSIKEKLYQERYSKDLKRKWNEKPSIAMKRDKEHKKFIKECRKDKLKELAERKNSPSKKNVKRKLPAEDNLDHHKAKVAKVKVTTHNRGAFLANNVPTALPKPPVAHGPKPVPANQFRIPKVNMKPKEPQKANYNDSNKKDPPTRSVSMDGIETFSQQISKPDALLRKRQNSDPKKCEKPNQINNNPKSAPLRRHSITETLKHPTALNISHKTTPPPDSSPICKEAIAARAVRTTNKITFASMEKNIVESEENKRKLCALSVNPSAPLTPTNNASLISTHKNSALKSCFLKEPNAKKKIVRFNDTPVIHYIERLWGASKKIINKDVLPMTTFKDRRLLIRTAYPIVDNTDKIISKILSWSNEWLIRRNADADAAGDVIYPMATYFSSFEHYQSIIFPLMKLEFVSTLEREFNTTKHLKNFKVSLEYATQNNDRIMLVTKLFIPQNKEITENSFYDLVILEPDKKGPQIFAYVVANRKGAGSFITIVCEIIAKNFTLEYFKAIKEFSVRPVMDKVRVHFGAFNAIYQMQSTPLYQKIINPLELLKCRPPPKKKVSYRGFDQLNDKQKQVLLNTYVKIIDETTPNITLIQGPPGTGKSLVITNLVLQTLYGEEVRYLDKKILICAQSNAAVDVIAGKLYDISMRMRPEKRFRVIRFGMLNKVQPHVRPIALQKVVEHDQLKKLQAKNKNIQVENKENLKNQIQQFEAQVADMSARNVKGTVEEDLLFEKKRQLQLMRNILNENMRPEDERSLYTWYLSNANIVCATLSSCVNLTQYTNFFDICIIDEATQCTEPWTLLPLKFGINSLVLVGDTQQLPATVLSKKANELGLGTSMFTRIQQCLDNIPCTSAQGAKAAVTTPNNIICSLQTQYRMHPEICRWPNQYFYRNELINGKPAIDFNKSPIVPFSILNLAYKQSNSCDNGKITNNLEAEFVAKLLKALDGFIPNKYNSYGVITPYAHHRAILESSIKALGLTNIMVNTIDSYQGLEKDVIVISNARTSGVGFLSNPQRLNVALTRSKKCLILCGNFKNLKSVPAWRCLLENARERKLYHEISENCIEDIHTNVIDKIKLKNQTQ